MKPARLPCILAFTLAGLGACDSKIETVVDEAVQARVSTVQDCFPNLYKWFNALLRITDTWRLRAAASSDPAGLIKTLNGGGLDVSYSLDGVTVAMAIRFYGPNGALQDLSSVLSDSASLAQNIDDAATELRDRFGDGEKFIHGVWSLSGSGISASGEGLTGLIGGATNDNELASLRTTTEAVSGGVPATDPSTVTDSGPPVCTLTFSTSGLITDEEVGQEYPRGTVDVEIVGPDATVTATVVFDKTATAVIVVDDIPGSFAINVNTRVITYRL
ncbi:MAG: hypothetical protein R3F29_11135 [Planctomycetota bacterium]